MANEDNRLKQSNHIEKWLNSHILELGHNHEIESLLIELTFLLDTTPSHYKIELRDEHQYLSAWIKKQRSNSDLIDPKNSPIYNNGIQDKSFLQEVSERYVIAFLASRASCLKINTYRSVYFLLCLKMVKLTDYESRIRTTLNECRYLTTKVRSFLVPFLPNILQTQGLQQLWQTLEEGRIQSTQQNDVNKKLSSYIYEFILPIENCFKNESGITRNVKQAEKLVDGSESIDDTTGNTISDLVLVTEVVNDNSAFEVEERQDDEEQSFAQVSITQPTNYYLDRVRAEQQINSRHQRTMSQTTDVNNAHPDDIKVLVNSLMPTLLKLRLEKLNDIYDQDNINIEFDINHQAELYLLMLLLSGLPNIFISENLKLSYQSYKYSLEFTPTRSVIQESWDASLCADNRDNLTLFFPEIVGRLHYCIANDISSKVFEQVIQQASNQLKNINKEHRTRLTINKVKNYISHFLTQKGRDTALIDVLTEQPINHQSALPYFNVSQYDLYSCQYDFIEHLTNMLDEDLSCGRYACQFFTLLEDKLTGYWEKQTGSALAISEIRLKDVVSTLRDRLQTQIDDRHLDDFESMVEMHNTFTDYLYIMLSISSGYRPVSEPFGRLDHIDTLTKKFFISDKENHQDTQGRFIYLPDTANEQIKKYVHFLQKNASILSRLDNPLGHIYQSILKSNIGLIVYLNFDKETDRITEVSLNKNYLHERLSKHINLPMNWHRHFIRSFQPIEVGLYSTNEHSTHEVFSHDLIGAWMGHADALGFDFYNRYSGLKRSELRRFSVYLDQVLKNIGFKTMTLERRK
ncbi:hypothetical protein [Psychrobacter sp. DAB_AL43B]|uniref:hypothetical protein n=1 Tax=Psychrobacter sp. DAB_AL43B TaxID=1028416 RepID=UPI0009A7A222|nr:hypothetical protein [Psychrobacter sp. DAB_AL43B]SLJ85216.1 hypothetical protein DABAL43B_2027 [Psychrobacter sp. DAB_AL43B]